MKQGMAVIAALVLASAAKADLTFNTPTLSQKLAMTTGNGRCYVSGVAYSSYAVILDAHVMYRDSAGVVISQTEKAVKEARQNYVLPVTGTYALALTVTTPDVSPYVGVATPAGTRSVTTWWVVRTEGRAGGAWIDGAKVPGPKTVYAL